LIIDSHTHMFQPEARHNPQGVSEEELAFRFTYGGGKFRMPPPEEMLAEMDGNGIDAGVLLPFPWLTVDACRVNNDYLLETASIYPDRFIPFAVVPPSAGRAAIDEARRCLEAGARGLGEFHSEPQRFDPLDLEAMAPLVDLALEFEIPILIHCNEQVGHIYLGKGPIGPSEMYRFVKQHPDVTIILAHWGGGLIFYELMPEVARDCGHVYYDSAASPFLYRKEIYGLASRIAGAEKILFGTDYPLIPFKRTVADARAGIETEEDAQRILGDNAAMLLKVAERD
jgi:predicted TIM-barrel fold metal-dependent hydrolase